MAMSSRNIHLYLTSEHVCGYLPDRLATNLVPDPKIDMDMSLYSQLIRLGYRRSGRHTYRPHCHDCQACLPCRIPLGDFRPRRNQRRCLRRNQDLVMRVVPAHYSSEYFALYRHYINSRHYEGDMVDPQPLDYRNFLYSEWSNTVFLEFRLQHRLVAVAVTDLTDSGLSAVYSFFDPALDKRSLGTFCILKQIEYGLEIKQPYLYMGYWIRESRKMNYKTAFHPLEIFNGNGWLPLDALNPGQ